MIVAAAIQRDGVTYIGAAGERHHHVIKQMRAAGVTPFGATQGFVTGDGTFLDRREAWDHAIECGQLPPQSSRARRLFSEDLW